MNDGALLRLYLERRDEAAFMEVARRHTGLVYSTALRSLDDPEAARDVSQAVFVLLARKAAQLTGSEDLASWLHRAACLKAREYSRTERRRRFREYQSADMTEHNAPGGESLDELAAQVDDTINQLPETERELILWRFYSRLSWETIAVRLGVSEDAARMRLKRTLEKLRFKLSVTSGISAAALAEWFEAKAIAGVPETLPAQIQNAIHTLTPGPLAPVTALGKRMYISLGCGIAALVGIGILFQSSRIQNSGVAVAKPTDPVAAVESTNSHLAEVRSAVAIGASQEQINSLFEKLRFILFSELDDSSMPPKDLQEIMEALVSVPGETLSVLLETVFDVNAPQAARSRAIWALWLLGEQSPNHVPAIIKTCAAVLAESGGDTKLWDDASEVLLHLNFPPGSIQQVAHALRLNPAAGAKILHFLRGAARKEPAIISALVRPWLAEPDPLRLSAAIVLAPLLTEDLETLLPILIQGLEDTMRLHSVCDTLRELKSKAAPVVPQLRALLEDSQKSGHPAWSRQQLVGTLAVVAPETRSELAEVDDYLRLRESAPDMNEEDGGAPVTLEVLVAGLKHPKTAWAAALDLEERGPEAREALPALRGALRDPALEDSWSNFSDAIKKIDPQSPRPLFTRNDLSSTLRKLMVTVSDLGGAGAIEPDVREELQAWIKQVRHVTPEELVEIGEELKKVHPTLYETFSVELTTYDAALKPLFSTKPVDSQPAIDARLSK